MTPFRHKMHHVKTMLLNAKIFCKYLKPFLSRIRANFYGNPSRNKKELHVLMQSLLFKGNFFINANQSE